MHKRWRPWRNDHGCRSTALDPDARPDRRSADDRFHEGSGGENRHDPSPPMPSFTAGRSRTARRSGAWSGIFAASSATRARRRARRWRQDARRLLLSRRDAELRREPAEEDRLWRRHRLSRRGQGRAAAVLERTARAGLAPAAAFPVARREEGRPHRGDDAQHAGDRRRHAGGRLASARSGRPARPISASRACSTVSARSSRSSSSRRTATGTMARRSRSPTRSRRWRQSLPTVRKVLIVDYLGTSARRRRDHRQGRGAGRGAVALRRQAGHLRAAAVFASALHPVFVGHDRHSQMHRPFGRRHADPARQGTPAACRPASTATASSTSPPAAG